MKDATTSFCIFNNCTTHIDTLASYERAGQDREDRLSNFQLLLKKLHVSIVKKKEIKSKRASFIKNWFLFKITNEKCQVKIRLK